MARLTRVFPLISFATLFALSSCSSPRVSSTASTWPAVCGSLRSLLYRPCIQGRRGTSALSFCDMVTGVSCCGAAEDEALREQFQAMSADAPNNAACSTIIKENLCAECIPSSSPLALNTPGSTMTAKSIPPQCVSSASQSSTASPQQDGTLCLERLGGEGSFLDMAAHPDGSQRAFFTTQDGKIWLLSIPTHGSKGTLRIRDGASSPFLDLTDRVRLIGAAFHPEFAANGRFFISYSCDTTAWPGCMISSPAGNGSSSPSQYQLVVAELSAKTTVADPSSEVRRIFTMDLPQPHTTTTTYFSYQQQQGGQILFQPSDGYLYLMTGHGLGEEANQEHFNNTMTSFLGKILRFNVGSINGQSAGTTTTMEEPAIFAAGLSNPRGCSFDSARPSYMFCATVDDEQHESVYLIGGPSANAASLVVDYGSAVSSTGTGTLSIVPGLVYRGSPDPSLKGRYLHKYGVSVWAAVETPASSGRYVSSPIPNNRCASSSPVPCVFGGVDVGRVVSFGEDNSGDAFVLATGGVYRVAAPGLCGAPRSRAAAALGWLLSAGACALAFVSYVFWKVFAGGQQRAPNCGGDGWFRYCFASIVCSCCNSVTNIHVPGAGSQAGLQLS